MNGILDSDETYKMLQLDIDFSYVMNVRHLYVL